MLLNYNMDLINNKPKSYSLILNSNTQSGSANKSDVQYTVDWSFLPENKQFEVYFTFCSNVMTTSSATQVPMCYSDAFNSSQVYEPKLNSTGAYKSTFIFYGVLNAIGSNTFFRTTNDSNPSIFLEGRPTRNTFNIQFFKSSATPTNSTAPVLWTNDQATPANMSNYTLTMNFIEV